MPRALWEILVPTKINRKNPNTGQKELWPVTRKYHKVWDAQVREISGGLTIFTPAKGHWINPKKEIFVERMIPVRIYCSFEEIENIADFTAKYYNQEAVMFYKISDAVTIKHYGG